MAERKMWLPEQDQVIKLLVEENDQRNEEEKWKWSDIAKKLKKRLPSSKRTGKQCRQRWHNQLDPSIKNDQWSPEEIKNLFELQNQHGNKWAIIAKNLQGRTDNNVKNFFYSSLRRSIRKLNNYVAQYKKRSNIKPFKPTLLTKILSITDENHRMRLDIKNQKAIRIALVVKNMLAELSQMTQEQELTEEDKVYRQKLVHQIQQFNRNCKRKKGKRVQNQQDYAQNDSQEQIQQEELYQEGKQEQISQKQDSGESYIISSEVHKSVKSRGTKNSQKAALNEKLSIISQKSKSKQAQRKQNDKKKSIQIETFDEQPSLFKRFSKNSQYPSSLSKKKSSFSRRDSPGQNGLFNGNVNSLSQVFEELGYNHDFDQPMMIKKNSSMQKQRQKLLDLNPMLMKRYSSGLGDLPMFDCDKNLKRKDSSFSDPILFRKESEFSKRDPLL